MGGVGGDGLGLEASRCMSDSPKREGDAERYREHHCDWLVVFDGAEETKETKETEERPYPYRVRGQLPPLQEECCEQKCADEERGDAGGAHLLILFLHLRQRDPLLHT